MSRREASPVETPERAALERLGEAVDQAVRQVGELRDRARAAESRTRELEALLARFSSGEEDPGAYIERLKALEDENSDLRGRIEHGREAAKRLLARIRFLEEQR